MKSFYIYDKENQKNCQPIYSLDVNVTCESIVNNSTSFVNNLNGLEGVIEPAGCSGEVFSQENHIVETFDGSVNPKNFVFRTEGNAPSTFGSFFRDDKITLPKGDIRGPGANDLSVSRNLCSQVASGSNSSILGGKNNTASGSNSVVVGGTDNVVSGTHSVVFGSNQTLTGFNSVTLTGANNSPISMNNGVVFSGKGNTASGSLNALINPENSILGVNSSRSTIITGSNQSIASASISTNSFIGTGSDNVLNRNNSAIISGKGNALGPDNNNIIFTGIGNTGTSSTAGQKDIGIITGIGNLIDTKQNAPTEDLIVSGQNNRILGFSNKIIFTGSNNLMDSNCVNSAIITGNTNTIPSNANNSWIGTGIQNINRTTQTTILTGSNNGSLTSGSSNSVIITGIGNNYGPNTQPNMCIVTGSNNSSNNSSNSCLVTGNSFTLTANSGHSNNCVLTSLSNRAFGGSNCGALTSINVNFVSNPRNSSILSGNNHSLSSGNSNQIIAGGENNIINSLNSGFFANQDIQIANSANSNLIVCATSNQTPTRTITGRSNAVFSSSNLSGGSALRYSFVATSTSVGLSAVNDYIVIGGNTNSNNSTLSSIISGSNNLIGNNSSALNIVSGSSNSFANNSTCLNSLMSGVGGFLDTITNQNGSAVFGSYNLQGTIGTPASTRFFMVGGGTGPSAGARRNAFSVTNTGRVSARLVFATGGADFGEYFESYDQTKLPVGETVCMIDETFTGKKIINGSFVDLEEGENDGFTNNDIGKIMLSSQVPSSVEPIGVLVSNSGFIGNSYDEEWNGKYERDENGCYIWEEIQEDYFEDVLDISNNIIQEIVEEMKISEGNQIYYQQNTVNKMIENNTPIMEVYPVYNSQQEWIGTKEIPKKIKKTKTTIIKKLSSLYDPTKIYIPRSQRPEWNLVALRGQVYIKEGQRISSSFEKIKDNYYLI